MPGRPELSRPPTHLVQVHLTDDLLVKIDFLCSEGRKGRGEVVSRLLSAVIDKEVEDAYRRVSKKLGK